MKSNALEYTKFILEKVSFDPQLFRKEYYKALAYLVEEDCRKLNQWIRSQFKPELIAVVAE